VFERADLRKMREIGFLSAKNRAALGDVPAGEVVAAARRGTLI